MNTRIPHLLAIYHSSEADEKAFFDRIKTEFSYLFDLDFFDLAQDQLSNLNVDLYQGLLTDLDLDLPIKTFKPSRSYSLASFNSASHILDLSRELHQFCQSLKQDFLSFLPFNASFYDQSNRLIYDNGQADGSFFFEDQEAKVKLEDWIVDLLQQNPHHSLHLQIPADSFEQILMQTYQGLYDAEGKFQGTYHFIQDLRPLLKSYLQESGQALVGWSDVTSGASIKDDAFED